MSYKSKQYEDSWREHDFNNAFIDWEHWVHRMDILNLEQASLLLNGLDPNIFTRTAPRIKREDIDQALDLSLKIKALAKSQKVEELSPTGWEEWAISAGFAVHNQFKAEVEILRRNAIKSSVEKSEQIQLTGPQPLTTTEIAEAFYDFKWKTSQEARKALGKKPAWLKSCVAIPGIQGRLEIRWHPVAVGAALYSKGYATAAQIRSRFRRLPSLQEWLGHWKDYEADYLSID